MQKVLAQPLIDILNKCGDGQRIMCHMVPLRVMRVIAVDSTFKSFRVEQLNLTNKDPNNPRGDWATLSAHTNPEPGAAYMVAWEAASKAQIELRTKLQKKMEAMRPPKLVRA